LSDLQRAEASLVFRRGNKRAHHAAIIAGIAAVQNIDPEIKLLIDVTTQIAKYSVKTNAELYCDA